MPARTTSTVTVRLAILLRERWVYDGTRPAISLAASARVYTRTSSSCPSQNASSNPSVVAFFAPTARGSLFAQVVPEISLLPDSTPLTHTFRRVPVYVPATWVQVFIGIGFVLSRYFQAVPPLQLPKNPPTRTRPSVRMLSQ